MRSLRLLAGFLFGILLLAAGVAGVMHFHRPGLEVYAQHHAPAASEGTAAVTATWFGTTAVLLRDREHTLFIDPFFTRPKGFLNLVLNCEIAPDEALIRGWLEKAGVKKLDAVLVSHSHYDHAMDAGVVARLTGATLMGSASTANIGRGNLLPEAQVRVITPGEPTQVGSFRIIFIESKHAGATGGEPTGDITAPLAPPARYLDYRQGGSYSILIEHAQGRVLHHGSAGFVPGALNNRRADVVLLGIALRGDTETYLHEVVDATGAHRVFPTHWDDFTRGLEKPLRPFPLGVRLDKFFEEMTQLRPQLEVRTFELGQPAALFERGGNGIGELP